MRNSGKLYIISAPSGAGKTSLVKALTTRHAQICVSISHTTRAMRAGEKDGVNYHFIDKSCFEQMIAQNTFIEYAEVFGHYYGTSAEAIAAQLSEGMDVILEIDWQGARQIKQLYPKAVNIFILPPSLAVLRQRLQNRGQDSEKIIDERMAQAVDEISHYDEYKYIVINDDFEQALNALESIFHAEKLLTEVQKAQNATLIENLLV